MSKVTLDLEANKCIKINDQRTNNNNQKIQVILSHLNKERAE